MREMNELEKQLRSWIPRRPSARLERRLCAARPAAADAVPAFRYSWVPAATAMVALMCVLVNQRREPSFAGSAGMGPMVAMILSNQSAAAYLPGSVQAAQNNLPADAFRWAGRRPSFEAVPPSPSRDRKQP